jgi:hypothetical protein
MHALLLRLAAVAASEHADNVMVVDFDDVKIMFAAEAAEHIGKLFLRRLVRVALAAVGGNLGEALAFCTAAELLDNNVVFHSGSFEYQNSLTLHEAF